MSSRPNLQANFNQQTSLMLAMALGTESQCGSVVVAESDPAYFQCWDMASPESLSPGGDFIPDGEVNVLDYSRQVRLQSVAGLGAGTSMLLSQAGALQYPGGPSDCSARRSLVASIAATWSVACPSHVTADLCYYDCNDSAGCMHSLAPVLSGEVGGGRWYVVPLPSGWTAFSVLFKTGMIVCRSSSPNTACVELVNSARLVSRVSLCLSGSQLIGIAPIVSEAFV